MGRKGSGSAKAASRAGRKKGKGKSVQMDLFRGDRKGAKGKTAAPKVQASKREAKKGDAPKRGAAKRAGRAAALEVVQDDAAALEAGAGAETAAGAGPAAATEPVATPEPEARAGKAQAARRRETAESLGKRQREISVAEFFQKNRHLLG